MSTQAGALPQTPGADPDLSLALTLCARLCHDLAGTLGALSGALDMAADGQEPEALALAADCAAELSARLRLLRVAWGVDSELPPLADLVAGLPGAERLAVDLSALSPALDEPSHRLSVNLLIVAAQGLPRGGKIVMQGGPHGFSVEIVGPRAAWPPMLAACLADPGRIGPAGRDIGAVGVAVACRLARRLGLRIVPTGPQCLTVVSPDRS